MDLMNKGREFELNAAFNDCLLCRCLLFFGWIGRLISYKCKKGILRDSPSCGMIEPL